jgi:chitinase
VIVSLGGQTFRANWSTFDISQIEKIVNEYGFDGIDLDFEGSSIPNSSEAPGVAEKIMGLVNTQRSSKYFMLTLAPEWPYITPYTYGSGQYASHAFYNQSYFVFIRALNFDNVSYIWPQSYNQGSGNGVTGPTKDSKGFY